MIIYRPAPVCNPYKQALLKDAEKLVQKDINLYNKDIYYLPYV